MNNRRKLIAALGASALATPFASLSQQRGKVRRIGFLSMRGRPDSLESDHPGAFLRGMRELGYVEGKNLIIEWRFADGKIERLPDLAADLIRANVEVIVSTTTLTTHTLQKLTTTIPIVILTPGDPVDSGFIKNLSRPEGNITGVSQMPGMSPKRLEILRSVNPKLSRIAHLFNPDNPANVRSVSDNLAAAQKLDVKLLAYEARTAQQIEDAFVRMARESVEALFVTQDSVFRVHRRQIAELALKYRLPAIATVQEFAEAGLLMSYGPNFPDIYRRGATYVDKLLKGAKPADLPVEQPMRFDFVVNKKTAKALGIKLPDEIMARAERFIE